MCVITMAKVVLKSRKKRKLHLQLGLREWQVGSQYLKIPELCHLGFVGRVSCGQIKFGQW